MTKLTRVEPQNESRDESRNESRNESQDDGNARSVGQGPVELVPIFPIIEWLVEKGNDVGVS